MSNGGVTVRNPVHVTYDVEYGQIPSSFRYRETAVTVRSQKYGLIPRKRRLSDLGVQTPQEFKRPRSLRAVGIETPWEPETRFPTVAGK